MWLESKERVKIGWWKLSTEGMRLLENIVMEKKQGIKGNVQGTLGIEAQMK